MADTLWEALRSYLRSYFAPFDHTPAFPPLPFRGRERTGADFMREGSSAVPLPPRSPSKLYGGVEVMQVMQSCKALGCPSF